MARSQGLIACLPSDLSLYSKSDQRLGRPSFLERGGLGGVYSRGVRRVRSGRREFYRWTFTQRARSGPLEHNPLQLPIQERSPGQSGSVRSTLVVDHGFRLHLGLSIHAHVSTVKARGPSTSLV